MQRPLIIAVVFLGLAFSSSRGQAAPPDPDCRAAVDKGLEWLAKEQQRDGHWQGNAGQYPTAMTALGGMALLMEGSTLREGRHAPQLRKAVIWLQERTQPDGLIGDPRHSSEQGRYMFGHGYGLLFLSLVYAGSEDAEQRKGLGDVLKRAVAFTAQAQTTKGGWSYVSAIDGSDFAEGCVTMVQIQSVRAARSAGLPIPKEVQDKLRDYVEKSTTRNGGVVYIYNGGQLGGERTPITAAALAALFQCGDYKDPLAQKWLAYCQETMPPLGQTRFGMDEYTHYYFAQVVYGLGEDGYSQLFPDAKPERRLTWSQYRKTAFTHLLKMQKEDGRWEPNSYIGPVYSTATFLAILQLEKGSLPFTERASRSSRAE